jgi:PTS system galactitol-specific IIA component
MKTDSVRVDGESSETVLREMGRYAFAEGYVSETYTDALLERESSYPTGLDIPTLEFGIAIPHADPEHVVEPAVILGIPEDTVAFRSMDDPDRTVDVELVVLLVVADTEGYTTFLSNLTTLFQDEEFVAAARERDDERLLDLIVDRTIET